MPRSGASSFNQNQRDCLDNLFGMALVDPDVRERLLVRRDPTLLQAYNLSKDTQDWLETIQANTLTEFAQAVLAATVYHLRAA
jgi:hypothetical protein